MKLTAWFKKRDRWDLLPVGMVCLAVSAVFLVGATPQQDSENLTAQKEQVAQLKRIADALERMAGPRK